MYIIIKSLRLKVLKVCYETDDDELKVSIFNIKKEYESIFTLKFAIYYGKMNNVMHLKIGGMTVQCKLCNSLITCLFLYQDEFQLAASTHLKNIFRCTSTDLKLSNRLVSWKRFPNFVDVTDTSISGKREIVEVSTVEEIMKKYPKQESIAIMGDLNGQFQQDSSIFHIENVYFHCVGVNAPLFLERFTGRFAIVNGARLARDAIPDFIEKWISGEKYQDLELLCIYAGFQGIFYFEQIFEQFRGITERWDPTKRPRNMEIYPRCIGFDRKKPFVIDCADYVDVKRKTDGRTASFNISSIDFHFFVWS